MGWGGPDRLCQTSPIPRSPDGDNNQTIINNTQVCDGKEDCSDGGDEQLCNFICYNMETIAMEVSRTLITLSRALISFFLTDILSHRKCATKFRTVLKAKTRTIARLIFPFEEFCFRVDLRRLGE